MKVSKRDWQILMAFGGILIAFSAYFFIFKDLQPKTDNLLQQNSGLSIQIARLEQLNAQQEQYKKDTADMKTETERIIGTYAYGLTREDEIMYMTQLENDNSPNMVIQNLNMSTPEEVPYIKAGEILLDGISTQLPESDAILTGEQQPAAAGAATPTAADNTYAEPVIEDNGIKLYREAIHYNFTTTYAGLKDILDSIYSLGSHKSIDNVSLAFDTETGNLAAEMQIYMYYLVGTQNTYQPLDITPMSTGVGNIFGTVDVMSQNNAGGTGNADSINNADGNAAE